MDDDWNPSASECPKSAFQLTMLEVVRACGSKAKFNRRMHKIVRDASAQSEQLRRGNGDIVVRSRRSRRLSGALLLGEELGHLVRQFEKFKPG